MTEIKHTTGLYDLRIFLIGAFFFLLGTHIWDYHPFVFVIASLFLISWNKLFTKETLVLALFIFSLYVTWFFLDREMLLSEPWRVGQGILLLSAYALGMSVDFKYLQEKKSSHEKIVFYLLFGFFIAYTFSLVYSYFNLPEVNGIDREGMYVRFPNEYLRLHVHQGNLISTIIAYHLTFMVVLLPFLLFYFKGLKEKGFYTLELLILISLSLFALYLASVMQRRTVFVLFLFSLFYVVLIRSIEYLRTLRMKTLVGMLSFVLTLLVIGYYIFSDTAMVTRLTTEGLHDKRFDFWKSGIQVMLNYPWGGGHHIFVGKNMRLAHNMWIDIGKDFGVIPFLLFVLFCLFHLISFIRFLFFKRYKGVVKHLIIVICVSLLMIWMIEPVFTSDKTFLVYGIFVLALMHNLSQKSKTIEL